MTAFRGSLENYTVVVFISFNATFRFYVSVAGKSIQLFTFATICAVHVVCGHVWSCARVRRVNEMLLSEVHRWGEAGAAGWEGWGEAGMTVQNKHSRLREEGETRTHSPLYLGKTDIPADERI